MLLQELVLEGRSGFPSPCAVPLPLASPRLSQTRPRRGAGLSRDLGTHTGVAAEPQGEGNPLVCPPEPLCAPGCSLPAALPPVSTDQPLSRGAPAAPLHQEISSQAQERQQQPRCDQGDQRLLRRVPVAPRALLFKGFYSKLGKKKKKHQREPGVGQTGNVCICCTGFKQCCSSPPWESARKQSRALLPQPCPSPGSPHVLTAHSQPGVSCGTGNFCPLEHTPGFRGPVCTAELSLCAAALHLYPERHPGLSPTSQGQPQGSAGRRNSLMSAWSSVQVPTAS